MRLRMIVAAIGAMLCLMGTYEAAQAQYGRVSGSVNVRFGNDGYYGGRGFGYNDGYYGRGHRHG